MDLPEAPSTPVSDGFLGTVCPRHLLYPVLPSCPFSRVFHCPQPRDTGGCHSAPAGQMTATQLTTTWMKQLTWLRIIHSGDRCQRLVLHTPSGACLKRRRKHWTDPSNSLVSGRVHCHSSRYHHETYMSSYPTQVNNLSRHPLMPLLPYGYSYKASHPVPDRVKPSFVIFDIRALWRSGLCQSARMSRQRVS